ncbi:unnamed protein product, partial [marine sediment metagenome]
MTTWDTDPNAIPPGSGPVPASGDNATITPTVTVTMTNGSWACANLTNNGTLDFDMNAGDVALTIDNGGVVFNSGTINFAAADLVVFVGTDPVRSVGCSPIDLGGRIKQTVLEDNLSTPLYPDIPGGIGPGDAEERIRDRNTTRAAVY